MVKKWLDGRREKPGRLSSEREKAQAKAFFAGTETFPVSSIAETPQPLDESVNAEMATLLDVPLESPRQLVWLLLRDPLSLGLHEQQMLAFIRQEPSVEVAYELAQQFETMVRQRQNDQLDAWIAACLASSIPDLETFAAGLQKEYAAIKAALTLPYSNGPVEGQVNRLKFIKRSMYGRGSFELLRQRVLRSA